MAYRHGVYIEEQATGLVTPVEVESALPVVVGTAPVHNLPEGTQAPVNEPKLYYSMPEFVAGMGGLKEGESPSDYTLYEMASLYFERYKVKPLVAINVFDPAKHTSPLEGEEGRTTSAASTAICVVPGWRWPRKPFPGSVSSPDRFWLRAFPAIRQWGRP